MNDNDDFGDLFSAKAKHKRPSAGPSTIGDRYPHGPGHRGVDTSVKAAESVRAPAPFMRQRILSFLVDCGAGGANYTEIANRCRMEVPTVCARMVELTREENPTVRISIRRRKTPSGRSARVYVHANFWNPQVDEEKVKPSK